jgi:hypothetical protein
VKIDFSKSRNRFLLFFVSLVASFTFRRAMTKEKDEQGKDKDSQRSVSMDSGKLLKKVRTAYQSEIDMSSGKMTPKSKFKKISRLIVSISSLKSTSSKERYDYDNREELMETVSGFSDLFLLV